MKMNKLIKKFIKWYLSRYVKYNKNLYENGIEVTNETLLFLCSNDPYSMYGEEKGRFSEHIEQLKNKVNLCEQVEEQIENLFILIERKDKNI